MPHLYHHKEETERDLTHTEEKGLGKQSRERLEDWSDEATSHRRPTATSSWNKQRKGFSPRASGGGMILILDFWLLELGENRFLLF